MRKAALLTLIMAVLFAATALAAPTNPPATIRQLTYNDANWHGAWSPNGNWVVYQRNITPAVPGDPDPRGVIYKILADGTMDTQVTMKSQLYYCDSKPTFSPNGKWIVFQRSEDVPSPNNLGGDLASIWKVKPNGTGEVRVAQYEVADPDQDGLNEGSGAQWPVWSPDGKLIAFHYGYGQWDDYYSRLAVVRPDGTGLKEVTKGYFGHSPHGQDMKWRPGLVSNQLVVPLINPTYFERADYYQNIAMVNVATPVSNKYLTDGKGWSCQNGTDWNRAGTKIIYTDDSYDQMDIWTMSPNGKGKVRLTNSEFDKEIASQIVPTSIFCYNKPTYSPNGRYIAFFNRVQDNNGDHRYLGIMTADGSRKLILSGPLRRSSNNDGADTLDFNPNGTMLLFRDFDASSKAQLFVADLDTVDTDADGLLNWEEALYGTNPSKKDTDHDGFNDFVEVNAGTDPTDPASHP